MTVHELINALEACDPDTEIRIAAQPSWPFEYPIRGSPSVCPTPQPSTSSPVSYAATCPAPSATRSAGNPTPQPTRAAAHITLDGISTVARLEVMVTPPPPEAVPRTDRRLRAALRDPADYRTTPGTTDAYSVWFPHDNAHTRRDGGCPVFDAALEHAYDHIRAVTDDLAHHHGVGEPLHVTAEVRLGRLTIARVALAYRPPDPATIPTTDRTLAQAIHDEQSTAAR
ncbi:hypothetical protein [Frankia sp. CiP3]|uniref:hypothetical protein n=1 Tax=Frankia sp. CiP3 TaxID=2880971 RepID=UPI001EF3F23D|nr:hypothetical protein [Frankia sp. CiP3]